MVKVEVNPRVKAHDQKSTLVVHAQHLHHPTRPSWLRG